MSRVQDALTSLRGYFPGVLVSLIIAVAATFLSEHYGGPVMLFALLFGMAFHFLHEEGRCVAGIEFASRSVLRLGASTIHPTILVPLVAMIVAFTLLFLTLHLAAMRNEIVRRRLRTLLLMQADAAAGA